MNATERKELKYKIVAAIGQCKRDIKNLEAITKPIAPENAIGRLTRMDAINNKSVNEATLRRNRMKLKRLETALNKINSPDFGDCKRCKRAIQPKRLMLMPESTLCIRCAR